MKKLFKYLLIILTVSIFILCCGFTNSNQNKNTNLENVKKISISETDNLISIKFQIESEISEGRSIIVFGSQQALLKLDMFFNNGDINVQSTSAVLSAISYTPFGQEITSHEFYLQEDSNNDFNDVVDYIEKETTKDLIQNAQKEKTLLRDSVNLIINSENFKISNEWMIKGELWKKRTMIINKKPNLFKKARDLHSYTEFTTFLHQYANGKNWYMMLARYSLSPDLAQLTYYTDYFESKVDFAVNNVENSIELVDYMPKSKPSTATSSISIGGGVNSNGSSSITFSNTYTANVNDLDVIDKSNVANDEVYNYYEFKDDTTFGRNTVWFERYVIAKDNANSTSIWFRARQEALFRDYGHYDNKLIFGHLLYQVIK